MKKVLPLISVPRSLDRGCFVAGTRVASPDGDRAIESLRAGDRVWSMELATGELVPQIAVATTSFTRMRVARVEVRDRVIAGVTADHLFYDPEARRWVRADALVVGHPLVLLRSGDTRPAAIARIAWREEPVEVYGLTVEGEGNYFAEGLLVQHRSL